LQGARCQDAALHRTITSAESVDHSLARRYIKRRMNNLARMNDPSGAALPAKPQSAPLASATLNILIAPNQMLKTPARPVQPADTGLVQDLVPRMFATMYKAPGIGLAAPQIGQSLRVVVVDLMPDDKHQPYGMINPEVVATSADLATREEGCLSLPNQFADVTRPAKVKIRYLDVTGARREIEAEGLLAACLQHEIDHLDGILFVDHLSILKRNMIMRRLAKEQRQKRDDQKR
jgi:peptide deformylase